MSDVAHPNLKSFVARYGEKDLSERVGLQCLFGGLMSTERGHITITRVLQTVLSALRFVGAIFNNTPEQWNKEYQRISKICDEIVDRL